MNQHKTNNNLWYSLGLVAVLCICLLVTAAGTALARYRQEEKTLITVNVRPNSQIYMGSMRLVPKESLDPVSDSTETAAPEAETTETEMVEVFDPTIKPTWKSVGADTMQMRLVVANGTSEADFSQEAQQVKLQFIGTLGLWNGTEPANISVQVSAADLKQPQTDLTEETTVPEETTAIDEVALADLQGTVTYIEEGSLLYSTYGNGWVYTFLLPDTETEYSWTLPGGKFSYIDLMITMNCTAVGNPSFLQPRIISDLVTD